jgi:DNA polymerase-3 subunit delta
VKNEIEKLKNYLGDESYSISSARKIITVEKEYQIYEIIERIMTNKVGEAFEYLNDNKEHMGILYSLYNEFEILKKMLDLKNQNINFSNNYNVFKGEFENYKTVFKNNGRIPHPYAIFNKKKYLENYTLEGVNEILYNCWETETNIKTGKIGMESGVERLITFISSKNNKK